MPFPPDMSVNGHHIDSLFNLALTLIVVAFVAVTAILLTFLVRYRAGNGRRAEYDHGNSKRALTLTLTLAAVVFVGIDVNLAWKDHHAWNEVMASPPNPADAFRVQVFGEQFQWNFRYPGPDQAFGTDDDIHSVGVLDIPANQPVLFEMTARDVIHSFFLPNFRVKRDVVPGMRTSLYIEATEAGTREIACAELCGNSHYMMRGQLNVHASEEEVARVLAERKKATEAVIKKWAALDEEVFK